MSDEMIHAAQAATKAATYSASGTTVFFGYTANELGVLLGLMAAVVFGVINIWINWFWKRKTYRLAVESAADDRRVRDEVVAIERRRQGGAISRTLITALSAATVSAAGLGFLAGHEGLRLEAYPDPGHGWRVPTICYGATQGIERGQVATFEECNRMLHRDAGVAGRAIASCVKVAVTQEMYDSMIAFTYNVGGAAFCRSTLVRKLNAGDCHGAAAEFDRWVFSGGQRLPGLIKRRAAERAMFESGCPDMISGR